MAVDDLEAAAPHARQRPLPDVVDPTRDQRDQRRAVGAVLRRHPEHLAQRGEHVDRRRQRVDGSRRDARPGHEQREVAEWFVDRHVRLAEHVALAEVVAVVGAHDDGRVRPQVLAIDLVEHRAEPVVDEAQLGPVVRPDVRRGAFVDDPTGGGVDRVRRPDDLRSRPVGVVARHPRLGHVEGLVRVELVDEQEEALCGRRLPGEPGGRLSTSSGRRGSRSPRGTTCASCRSGGGSIPRGRARPGRRSTTGPAPSATGRPRDPRTYSQPPKSVW